MHSVRALPLLAIVASIAPALASDEVPLTSWPSPLLWQPSAAGAREALVLPSAPLPFVATTPCRQYDSRSQSALPDNTPRTVTLTGAPCNIPATAQAAAVNITVFGITGAGSNGVFKVGVSSPPTTAWINYPPTETQRANAGVVALTDAGAIVVQVNQGAGSVQFVVDVAGYYASAALVTSVNALSGDVTLAPGSNVSITPSGNTLTIAATGGGGPPSGPAGGSLTGTYPNPGIASGAVGATQLANSTAVRSINGAAQDLVTIQGSGAVSVGTAGGTLTIGATSGSMVLGAAGDTTLIGAGYTEIATGVMSAWQATATSGAPSGRGTHTAVWTGTKMIVWGGASGGGYFNDGGQYDPVSDSWSGVTTTGAPAGRSAHVAVWTGTKMVVWGGRSTFPTCFNTGGQYDPVGNSWTATSIGTYCPAPRTAHSGVWTGTRLIVWGGRDFLTSNYFNDGGAYDPAGNSWSALSTSGAPAARWEHTAVWTGTKMVVWGGHDAGSGYLFDGSLYDPAGDSWTPMTTNGAPVGRYDHTAIWTGSMMVVWGGSDGSTNRNDGGLYDPVGDSWSGTSLTGAPSPRSFHTALWTGSKMVIWGGAGSTYPTDVGLYDPAGDSWSDLATSGAPTGRYYHSAIWTGSKMIIWGGYGGAWVNDGGQWMSVSLFMKN